MKTLKVFFIVAILLPIFVLSNCDPEPNPTPLPCDTCGITDPETFNYDYFPYYANSVFQFNVKTTDSNGDMYGNMSLFVESFDKATHTAKLIVSKNFKKNIPVSDYFYVRKTEENTLEFSKDGSNWSLWLDCETLSSDFKFLMTGPVGKPSNLLGSVNTKCESSTITTDAGSFLTIMIDAAYDNSSYDDYVYDDQGSEHFDKKVGLVSSYMLYVDWSMGYPHIISMNRTIELSGYKIYLPDGSVLEAGEIEDETSAPTAPENLEGERLSGTSIKLQWDDKSLNESEFQIERKEYGAASFDALTSTSANSNEYSDNTVSADKRYEYRVRAENNAGLSDYTNELAMNLYGVPETPWEPSGGYNSNLNYLFLMWWAKYSDNITHFTLAYPDGDNWIDYEFDVNSVPDGVSNDKWLQSTKLYYNSGQPWPAGIYQFRVKAVNSYGESYYSEIIEVNPYGKKSTNFEINYKLIHLE